jgi:transmembrane sensor
MTDYRYYKMADEQVAWKALQRRMEEKSGIPDRTKVIQAEFRQRPSLMRLIFAVAAISAGIIALLWVMTVRNSPVVYQTAENTQQINLSDGTAVTLHAYTRIEVPRTYGKRDRNIRMDSGEAEFAVEHHVERPFSVEMGSSLVRDIGTRFIIRKEDQMIHLAVSEGKVSFIRTSDGKGRDINAGSSITYNTSTMVFGDPRPVDSSKAVESLLSFKDAPLGEVLDALHTVFGKQVTAEAGVEQRKLTAKLYGMPYDTAIQVICISLGLESETNNGVTFLKSYDREQQ